MNKTCGEYGGMTKAGNPCMKPAGHRTNHSGEGKCNLHGGSVTGRPITTGVNAKVTSRQLKSRIEKHIKNPDPLDLTPELALFRSLIDHFRDKLEEAEAKKESVETEFTSAELKNQDVPDPMTAFVAVLNPIMDNLRKIVDTISKVQAREALTNNESVYLMVKLADVLSTSIHHIREVSTSDEAALQYIFGKLRNCIEIPRFSRGEDLLEGGG